MQNFILYVTIVFVKLMGILQLIKGTIQIVKSTSQLWPYFEGDGNGKMIYYQYILLYLSRRLKI